MSEQSADAVHEDITDGAEVADAAPSATSGQIDLDAVACDLDAVDAALTRLADGSYWTDEVSGEAIPPDVLEADPLARRA